MNNKTTKIRENLILILLVVTVIVMSVGFAAYTRNIDIEGNATFEGAKWSIVYDNYTQTQGSVTPTYFNNSGTVISYKVTLKPGEFYEFDIKAHNEGTFDAKLSSITLDPGTVNSDSEYYTYTVMFDGVTYNESNSNLNISLDSGESKTLHVKLQYKELTEENNNLFPDEDESKTFNIALNFTQAV